MTEYQKYQLQWMIDHGFSLKDLIHELDELREESDPDMSLESIFADWEYGYGFSSEIWVCESEWEECEGSMKSCNGEKEIHFYERDLDVPADKPYCRCWYETERVVQNGAPYIITTQMGFLSTNLIEAGYRVFIHPANGVQYEIRRGMKG